MTFTGLLDSLNATYTRGATYIWYLLTLASIYGATYKRDACNTRQFSVAPFRCRSIAGYKQCLDLEHKISKWTSIVLLPVILISVNIH